MAMVILVFWVSPSRPTTSAYTVLAVFCHTPWTAILRLWRVLPSVWFVTPSRARIDATAGTLASYAFIFRDAFTGTPGELLVMPATNPSLLEAFGDVHGDMVPNFLIALPSTPPPTAQWFVCQSRAPRASARCPGHRNRQVAAVRPGRISDRMRPRSCGGNPAALRPAAHAANSTRRCAPGRR